MQKNGDNTKEKKRKYCNLHCFQVKSISTNVGVTLHRTESGSFHLKKETKKIVMTWTLFVVAATIVSVRITQNHPGLITAISDFLYTLGSLAFMWGIIIWLSNMHMFTSASYAFRSMHNVIKNKAVKGSTMKEDYLHYRNTRPHREHSGLFVGCGVCLIVVSAFVSLFA